MKAGIYPRLHRWDAPKPESDRRCVPCGRRPAGKAFLRVAHLPDQDLVLDCCRSCKSLPPATLVNLFVAYESCGYVHSVRTIGVNDERRQAPHPGSRTGNR